MIKTLFAFALFLSATECVYRQAWGDFVAPQTKAARRALDFHFIDVEGGAATLIVTPAGESVLIDAGWDRFDGRDAKRIRPRRTKTRPTTREASRCC